jgi:hypothetical protein
MIATICGSTPWVGTNTAEILMPAAAASSARWFAATSSTPGV